MCCKDVDTFQNRKLLFTKGGTAVRFVCEDIDIFMEQTAVLLDDICVSRTFVCAYVDICREKVIIIKSFYIIQLSYEGSYCVPYNYVNVVSL